GQPQRLRAALDRIGRIGVQVLVAQPAQVPHRPQHPLRRRELAQNPGLPGQCAPWTCTISARSSLISLAATAGKNRRNKSKYIKKKLMVPPYRLQSTQVG